MNTPVAITRSSSDVNEIAKQFQVELALLVNIEESLRIVLDWKTGDRGIVRKLSTLRFVTRSFERHLIRLRALSEYGGYMDLVTDIKPNLANEVLQLRKAGVGLQADMERMIVALELVSPSNIAGFNAICTEYESYLEALKAHGMTELELYQRALIQEEGGSG